MRWACKNKLDSRFKGRWGSVMGWNIPGNWCCSASTFEMGNSSTKSLLDYGGFHESLPVQNIQTMLQVASGVSRRQLEIVEKGASCRATRCRRLQHNHVLLIWEQAKGRQEQIQCLRIQLKSNYKQQKAGRTVGVTHVEIDPLLPTSVGSYLEPELHNVEPLV